MTQRGKKYRQALEQVDRTKLYALDEAVSLVRSTSPVKFDGGVEIHLNLGIDPKQAEQQIRTVVSLPHGTGKKVRVIAFVSDDKVKEAKEAGAIEAGNENLIAKIEGGWMDFDVAVATPDMMKTIAKIARVLGQAGLMPNPKSGTVTPDVVGAIENIMKGQVEMRNDKLGNLHNLIGKVSFEDTQLLENAKAYLKTVQERKPSSSKGVFVNSITLCSTMGPGVKVEVNETMKSL